MMTVTEGTPPNVLGSVSATEPAESSPDERRTGRRRSHQGHDLGDMHDLDDSMDNAVRSIGVHRQHVPSAGRGLLGAESAPSRLGMERHYGSSALHLPD